MDEKTVRSLEKRIEAAVLEAISDIGLKRLPLLPSHQTMHLMAEQPSPCTRQPWRIMIVGDPPRNRSGLIALDLGRRPILVEQSGEDRRERVTGLNRFEIPGESARI